MIIVPSLTTVSKASKELLQKSQNDSIIIICMHDVCMCVQSNIVGPLLRVLK